jgi:hypothetical protein
MACRNRHCERDLPMLYGVIYNEDTAAIIREISAHAIAILV